MVVERQTGGPQRILPRLPKTAPLLARAVRGIARVGHGLWVHNATGAASSMAFNFFLSLVPLFVLVGFALGSFVRKSGVDEFMSPFLDTVPAAAADVIRHQLERLAGPNAASIAPLSIVGFLWLTSSGTHHMMDVLEEAVGALPRPWVKQRVIALGAVVGGLLTICATTWVLIEVDGQAHSPEVSAHAHASAAPPSSTRAGESRKHVAAAEQPSPPPARRESKRFLAATTHSWWENAAAIALMLAVGASGLAGFYRYAIEHPPGVRRRAWPGALVALGSWLAVSWGFGAYVISLGKYAFYYGSLAAVAVLMVWLWLASLALLVGAEVNAQLEGVRQ